MHVPFLDLKAQYESMQAEIDAAIRSVIAESAYIGGSVVTTFERAFASWLGTRHCVGCANGTDSMEILLKAMGVGPGDEVLVPAHSWISTSEAVGNIGASPVFVDTHPTFHTIDVSKLEAKISSRSKAVIPVHLYGLPAEMGPLLEITRRRGLKVIEDCAQAHGATYHGKKVGTFGDAASFSFYPGKNLGAYGDAGCMTTDDDALAEKSRMIANHGQLGKHNHRMEGRNSRLDGLQAAILSAKLPHLDAWNAARKTRAALYDHLLSEAGVAPPLVPAYSRHAYHLYTVEVEQRESVQRSLSEAGVETAVHYPQALPLLPAYTHLAHTPSEFPNAARATARRLSLPMFAELRDDAVAYTCQQLSRILRPSRVPEVRSTG